MKLRMWYSVFGANETCPDPASFASALRPAEKRLAIAFDAQAPWRNGTIELTSEGGRLLLSRYDRDSEEFRSRMDTLLGALPSHVSQDDLEPVRAHLRRAVQMINLHPVALSRAAKGARICEQICGHLARVTDGLIQVFQEGVFNALGESICPRCDKHRLKTS